MAKQNNKSHQLVRSNERLLGLGMFSVALLLGVLGLANYTGALSQSTNTQLGERTIKIEDVDVSNALRDVDSSYASEATASNYMQDMPMDSMPGY